jgi:hypothetical protein
MTNSDKKKGKKNELTNEPAIEHRKMLDRKKNAMNISSVIVLSHGDEKIQTCINCQD